MSLLGCASTAGPLPTLPRPAVAFDGVYLGAFDVESLHRGTRVGRYRWTPLCSAPADTVFWLGRGSLTRGTKFAPRVREALRAEGVATLDADLRAQARVRLSGRLTSVDLTLCRVLSLLAEAPKAVSGAGTVAVEWTIVAGPPGTPPITATTNGKAELTDGVPSGDSVILEWAIIDAARALARTPAFRDAARVAPPPVDATAPIDARARVPSVGAPVLVETGGRRREGTVAGRSRRPDTGAAVVLLDLGGAPAPRDATVSDAGGRVFARSLGAGPWNQAAWIGLTAAEILVPSERSSIDPSRPAPTYQPDPGADPDEPDAPDGDGSD